MLIQLIKMITVNKIRCKISIRIFDGKHWCLTKQNFSQKMCLQSLIIVDGQTIHEILINKTFERGQIKFLNIYDPTVCFTQLLSVCLHVSSDSFAIYFHCLPVLSDVVFL